MPGPPDRVSPSGLMARAEDFVVRMQEPEVPAAAPARGGRWFHQAERVRAAMAPPPAEPPTAASGREELHRLIDRLPDEDVPLALELARRLLREPPDR